MRRRSFLAAAGATAIAADASAAPPPEPAAPPASYYDIRGRGDAWSGGARKGSYLYLPEGSHLAMYDDQQRYFDGLIAFLRGVEGSAS